MVLPTLFSAHAPAAQHRARRTAAGVPAPSVTLSPLDAFLLTRIAAFLPQPLTVLDLAADATDGDSVAVLRGAGLSVVAPRLSCTPRDCADWRPCMMDDEQDTLNPEPRVSRGTLTLLDSVADDGKDGWRQVADALPLGGVTLVLLAETDKTAPKVRQHFAELVAVLPNAPILVLPLGAIGTSAMLPAVLAAHPADGTHRFIALREQAPFFAESELGLSFSCDDPHVTDVLDRLTGLVAGNFQFLPLVRDLVAATRKIAVIEAARAEAERAHRERLADVEAQLAQTEAARAMTEALRVTTEAARVATEAARVATEAALMEAEAGLHQAEMAHAEKSRYADELEERLRYFEEEYLPWKDDVITNLEAENRGLRANKAVRAERLVRRVLRLVRR